MRSSARPGVGHDIKPAVFNTIRAYAILMHHFVFLRAMCLRLHQGPEEERFSQSSCFKVSCRATTATGGTSSLSSRPGTYSGFPILTSPYTFPLLCKLLHRPYLTDVTFVRSRRTSRTLPPRRITTSRTPISGPSSSTRPLFGTVRRRSYPHSRSRAHPRRRTKRTTGS